MGYARLIPLAFQGLATISRLLRVKGNLPGQEADALSTLLAQTLDELSAEWGVPL